ncbi:MAG: MBL fold metallo-hydrolase [Candidatus Moranbacteria bacterium]|nr:MBL fold metallo-hydrolase [Candidatus Moranbacteria bacterium]MBP9801135.1 MBL fold metallo-hydrolase [Candidatus Moranbacteria bacterium]
MRIRTLSIIALLCFSVLSGAFLVVTERSFSPLRVIFLDVGQGDAILISQGQTQVLIDGGRDGKTLLGKLGQQMPFWDRQIELILATHPDADHIGGLAAVIRRYRVATYLSNGVEGESEVFRDLRQALDLDRMVKQSVVGTGSKIIFPGGAELQVLFPKNGAANTIRETNEGSVVARLVSGNESFLLTGDLPREETVLPGIPPTQVLKVAHHGSKYSTSETWLTKVRPKAAVISVGKNRYGHPSEEVLSRLQEKGIRILRTDEQGDIVYICREKTCSLREKGW